MTTLLNTHKGSVPMHTLVEEEMELTDKFIYWEALRQRINTIGARDALDEAVANMEGRQ